MFVCVIKHSYTEFGHELRRIRNQPTLSRLHFLFGNIVDWWSINSDRRTNHAAAVLPIIPLCLRRFINYSTSIIQVGHNATLQPKDDRRKSSLTPTGVEATRETLLLCFGQSQSVSQQAESFLLLSKTNFCLAPRVVKIIQFHGHTETCTDR